MHKIIERDTVQENPNTADFTVAIWIDSPHILKVILNNYSFLKIGLQVFTYKVKF